MTGDAGNRIDDLMGFAREAIYSAGKEALLYYGKRTGNHKFDKGLVTKAELQIYNLFKQMLNEKYPTHIMFKNNYDKSEYTHDDKRYLWIFDPIDGVDNFQAGIPIWGISLALFENFWPVFGAFYMPATGDLFHAQAGKNAYWGENQIRIPDQDVIGDESLMLTFSRFHSHYTSNFPGKMRNLGCTGAHLCYVAMGRADAAITANESFQDLAAARVVVEAAGGNLFKVNGDKFYLNEHLNGQRIEENLLVTSPSNRKAILECLNKLDA